MAMPLFSGIAGKSSTECIVITIDNKISLKTEKLLRPSSHRARRVAGIASLAVIDVLFTMLLSAYISDINALWFREVVSSCDSYFATSAFPSHLVAGPVGSLSLALKVIGLFVIALCAVWSALVLGFAGKAVVTLQLSFFSVIYQWLAWRYFHSEGAPLSYLICIFCGLVLGALRKQLDRSAEIIESKKAELQLRNKELLDSRILIVKQDEMERRLLAADLHDQVLNDLKLVLKSIQDNEKAPNSVPTGEICNSINDVMHEIRLIMDNLCPYSLEHFGLSAALQECLEKAAKKGRFKARFKQNCADEIISSFGQVEQQLIYRLVQESLTNVVKHAGAKSARVEIERDHDQVVFRVTDDGAGFDVSKSSDISRGLTYMKLRAALIEGSVRWQSTPGSGTTVEIRLPSPE